MLHHAQVHPESVIMFQLNVWQSQHLYMPTNHAFYPSAKGGDLFSGPFVC